MLVYTEIQWQTLISNFFGLFETFVSEKNANFGRFHSKLTKISKHYSFPDFWGFGTPKILLKLCIKLIPTLVKLFQPYFFKRKGIWR